MMYEPCSPCSGFGYLVTGERIGPCEVREESRIACRVCNGACLVPIDCAYCGKGTPAEVMDSGQVPKCLKCYVIDHPEAGTVVTLGLVGQSAERKAS